MRGLLQTLGALAGLFGAAGVALAAYGAHRSGNPTVTTAAYFLLVHAAGLAALCAAARERCEPSLVGAGAILGLGTLLFAGDLALRSIADVTLLRMAAPVGGVLMILGWLTAAYALPVALRR